MANNKKSFILYCDLIHTIEHLTDEQAGNLFKHILNYVNDRNPITENVITKLAFEPIKQQLKRDLKDWDEKINQRSTAGLNSALSKFILKLDLSNKKEIELIKNDTELRLKENKDNEYLQQVLNLCNERLTKSTTVESVEVRSTKSTVTVTDTVTDINSSSIQDAYEFLKQEVPSQIDVFKKAAEKELHNYNKFIEWFNADVESKKLEYNTRVLMGHLKKLKISFLKNQPLVPEQEIIILRPGDTMPHHYRPNGELKPQYRYVP